MSHIKFEANLKSLYYEMTSYTDMRNFDRIDMLIRFLGEDKDFRYLIPLFLMKDFDIVYFLNYLELNHAKFYDLSKFVYSQVRVIANGVKYSQSRLGQGNSINRCAKPVVNVSNFDDTSDLVFNEITYAAYDFKLRSSFFYEHLQTYNLAGPLYAALKDKTNVQGKKKDWESLPIDDRKIVDNNCVIEYYIFTGRFPIEGRLLKNDSKHNAMYLTPTVQGLRAALNAHDAILLGCNMSQYEKLPKTIKMQSAGLIRDNYLEIKKHTNKRDLPYLNAWRLGQYQFKKETES